MTESEWLACDEPDMLLEVLEGKVPHAQLVDFVRRCWQRIVAYLPPEAGKVTIVEEFAALAPQQSEHDAVVYAAEAALKAARWAPDVRAEQKQQAALLRQLVRRPL
jgi:hypothetical protein